MKVVCIKSFENSRINPNVIGTPMIPEVGSVYTVIDQKEIFGTLCYRLAECTPYGYNARHFAPCSDIDETELITKKEDALV